MILSIIFALLSFGFWWNLLWEFLGIGWDFFTSWEFLVAMFFFSLLKFLRKAPEVIEEVISGDGPEKHYRHKECPPWFPNGWQPVIASKDIKKGAIKPLTIVGHDIIVFRGVSGKAHVLDAYCPHLGANIGVGGSVIDDQIKCPFHGWQFNADGTCASVPGLEPNETPKAQIKKVWQTEELNGFVLVWFNPKEDKPEYKIDPIQDIVDKKAPLRCRITVNMETHIQEINEMFPDERHYNVKPRDPKWFGWIVRKCQKYSKNQKVIDSKWKSEWHFDENSAIATAEIESSYKAWNIPVVEAKYKVTHIGPSYGFAEMKLLFWGTFDTTVYRVHGIIQQNMVDQQVSIQIFSSSYLSAWMYKFCIWPHIIRDKLILDHKKFLARPYITHSDIPRVTLFRHWYNQFYDQTSEWIANFKDPWIIDEDGKVRDEDGNVVEDFNKEEEDDETPTTDQPEQQTADASAAE